MGLIGTSVLAGIVISFTISDTIGKSRLDEGKPLQWAINCYNDGFISKADNYKLALKSFVSKYGGNYYQLYKVIECESSWNGEAIGDSGEAYSLAQFHKTTFLQYCKGNYYNPYNQLECFVQMMNKNLGNHWSCFRKLN